MSEKLRQPTADGHERTPYDSPNEEQYESLLNDNESETQDLSFLRAGRRRWLSSSVYLHCLPLTIALVLVIISSTNIAQLSNLLAQTRKAMPQSNSYSPLATTVAKPTGDEFGHCGRSIEEARRLGCVFDAMSWAWQRPECYNAELAEDFLARMDWRFYVSNETHLVSHEVPRESMLRGDHRVLWAVREWHNFHCSYSMRKFHQAILNKKPIDDDVMRYGHTMHCDEVVLHDLDPKLKGTEPCDFWPGGCQSTELQAGFNKCGWY